jgi:hypothetical protein
VVPSKRGNYPFKYGTGYVAILVHLEHWQFDSRLLYFGISGFLSYDLYTQDVLGASPLLVSQDTSIDEMFISSTDCQEKSPIYQDFYDQVDHSPSIRSLKWRGRKNGFILSASR